MLTWIKAASLFGQRRSGADRKPLANNTYLYKRGDDFAVRLHSTDVVTIHHDDTFTLNSGGWQTVTTKERINRYAPVCVSQERGVWYVGPSRVLFFDGIRVDGNGRVLNATPAEDEARTRKSYRDLDKQIARYIDGYCAHLADTGKLVAPDGGDCWGCLFSAVDGKPREHSDPMGLDHYLMHFGGREDQPEPYYVPALLWNALKEHYANPPFVWGMIDSGLQRHEDYMLDMARRALIAFFRRRKARLRALLNPEVAHA